jgi:hypothetical protein
MDRYTALVALTALLASGVVLSLFVFHVGRALADRIRGGGSRRPGTDEMQALRDEVTAELHQVRADVAELAERLDFAERLLAKERETPRLGQGGR